jgi:hypothetical protein
VLRFQLDPSEGGGVIIFLTVLFKWILRIHLNTDLIIGIYENTERKERVYSFFFGPSPFNRWAYDVF